VIENSVKPKMAQNEITDIPHYFVSVYDYLPLCGQLGCSLLVIGGIFALLFGP
jgi:hypothetical protein